MAENMDVDVSGLWYGTRNPFPGLRPFKENESDLFFGRDSQRTALLRRLRRSRFVAVVGTSGSGKSSLIFAGLLPALRGGLRTRFGSSWRVAVMRPGARPIARLTTALGAAGIGSGGGEDAEMRDTMIETSLRRSDLGLIETVRQARLEDNVLVVVDQFEELFRIRPASGESGCDRAAAFVRLLLEASAQNQVPVYVLITMRSDFLGDCARFMGLPEAINRGQYLIPRLTRDERRQVIVGPMELRGRPIAPRLVHRLLNDMSDDPDMLPVLQHSLMRMWQYSAERGNSGVMLDLEHYEAIGTMAAALERHADEAYLGLPVDTARRIAKKIFQRLTEVDSEKRATRHPSDVRDLCAVTGESQKDVRAVISAFRQTGRSFVYPGSDTPLEPEVVIDISHESLIRAWRRLRRWVAQETQAAEDYVRLAERAERHREGKDTLLADPALQLALDWREQNRPNEVWARRYHPQFDFVMAFLDASLAQRQKEEAEREAARRRELEQARALAREQRRRYKALRVAAVILALGILGTAVAASYAWRQAQLAASYELADSAMERLGTDPDLGVLLALHAVDRSRTHESWFALNRAVQEVGRRTALDRGGGPIQGVAFDGERLLAADAGGEVRVWDVGTGRSEAPLGNAGEALRGLAASVTGAVVTWGAGGQATVRSAATGEALYTVDHGSPVASAAFSSDGTRLATGGWDAEVKVWDTSGRLVTTLRGHTEAVAAVAFSRDGQRLATGGWDATARLWEIASGSLLHTLRARDTVTAVAFSPDGSRVAYAGRDAEIEIWASGEHELLTLIGHGGPVAAVAFSPDGSLIASASWDTTAKVWNAASGKLIQTFFGHQDWVNGLAFSSDGGLLATAGDDGRVMTWAVRGADIDPSDYLPWQDGLAHSPDDARLAVVAGGGVQVLEPATGRILRTLAGDEPIHRLAFSHDGRRLATAGAQRVDQYHLEDDDLIAFAGKLVRRELTDEECGIYLHAKHCPPTPFADP